MRESLPETTSAGHARTRAAEIRDQNLHYLRPRLLSLPGKLFASEIRKDDLRVSTEGEVLKLIFEWSEHEERSEEEVLEVLECVRYPHVSQEDFQKLLRTFEFAHKSTSVQLCLNRQFKAMPEAQLTRRKFYLNHVHLIWQTYEKQNPDRPQLNMPFKLTCLHGLNGEVVSHAALEEISEPREKPYFCAEYFQFLTVMNTLYFVNYSGERSLAIYKRKENCKWSKHAETPDCFMSCMFIASVHGDKIILVDDEAFTTGDPDHKLKFVEVDTKEMDSLKILRLPQGPQEYYTAIRQMDFSDDFIVLLVDTHIKIFDRKESVWRLVDFSWKMQRFDAIVQSHNDLHVYGSEMRRHPPNSKSLCACDALYTMDLNTGGNLVRIPDIDSMFPQFKTIGRVTVSCSKFSAVSRRTLRDEENQGESMNVTEIFQFDPFKTDLSTSVKLRYDCMGVLYTVPSHVHVCNCNHRTMLQDYCNSLHDPSDCKLLARLAYFL